MTTTKVSQVNAVVSAVTEVLGDSFVAGKTVVSETITDEQKQAIKTNVVNAILSGTVSCNKDTTNEREFFRYVNGMINNHFMKSKKLNGGGTYRPTTKGTPRDSTLKELTKYLATQAPGSSTYRDTVTAIGRRKAELSQVAGGIDTSVAPTEVSNLINNTET